MKNALGFKAPSYNKTPITKKSDTMKFGKYKDRTVQSILLTDPSYIMWLHRNDIVSIDEDIVIEAEVLEYEEDEYGDEISSLPNKDGWGDDD